jgi:ribonucleoside-diphosphate reductase alpha chain
MDAMVEIAALSVAGGGVGIHNQIRATSNKAPGPIPYMKVVDGLIGYWKQSKNRRGACAWYMDVSHPDIVEHVRFRLPGGGDSARRADNRTQFHCAVNITDDFIDAVEADSGWDLVCPHSGEVRETLRARSLWEEILEARALTGEPYLLKIDTANRDLPEAQRALGLTVNGSNLCSEITLPTNSERTFVCCLSSLNLEKYDEWKDTTLVGDLTRFLDNVIQFFIENAGRGLEKAVFSARMERALGIGAMGWHYYLQSNGIPIEGGGVGSAIQQTHIMFKNIKAQAVEASEKLAQERGEAPDMHGTGLRNSHLLAIAPNSNNSIILGTSPAIEPVTGNAYTQTTRAGAFLVKNPYFDALLKSKAAELSIAEDRVDSWIEEQWSSVVKASGSVQHLSFLTDQERELFKTAFEIDQHWLIECADARQQYICQAQSLNLFFPAGVSRAYYNSVHMRFLRAPHLKTVYYSRMERGVNADVVQQIERKSLQDWSGDNCVACEG